MLVIIFSLIFCFEWLVGISIQGILFPGSISMKFTTAVAFLISGVMLLSLNEWWARGSEWGEILVPVCVLALIVLGFPIFVSGLLGLNTGFEQLFVNEASGTAKTVYPGQPSLGTVLCFFLLGICGMIAVLGPKKHPSVSWIGLAVCMFGLLAIMGYLLGAPPLYFGLSGLTNPMAIATASLFILLGLGFSIAGKSHMEGRA